MTDLIWGVDLQHDFCVETGALYVPGAHEILPNVRKVTALASNHGIARVMSADDHTYGDPEIVLGDADPANGLFNPHCMRGTAGAQIVQEAALTERSIVVDPNVSMEDLVRASDDRAEVGDLEYLILKQHFNVFTNPRAESILDIISPDMVYVYGVATDVCVNAAVLGLLERGLKVTVVHDAIAGLDKLTSALCVTDWCAKGARIISTEELRERIAQTYGEKHMVEATDEAQDIRP